MYEKHQREYTIVGSTFLCGSIVGNKVISFFGGQLSEIISVVKDGTYFHFQVLGERENMVRCLANRINLGKVNLEKEYVNFNKQVAEFEKFIDQDSSLFTKNTILELFNFYDVLMPVALACIDILEVIDEISQEKRAKVVTWSQKTRVIEETIYKNGEFKFIPRYLKWLVEKHLPDYKPDELKYLIFTELKEYLLNNAVLPSPDILRERKKLLFVREYPVWKIEYCSGIEAEKEIGLRKLLSAKSDGLEKIQEIKGNVAFPGKITGKARLIRSKTDMKDFVDGEIIVSPMTMPDYLPIMKRAAAFITNEGGTLCHAAIVARELQKPCVIGTKIATHVFKDGDMIAVDADNGIIKKINKN
jgi:phosphohistidine swiveling domain-containing protein